MANPVIAAGSRAVLGEDIRLVLYIATTTCLTRCARVCTRTSTS
jgi:hypothetical protein